MMSKTILQAILIPLIIVVASCSQAEKKPKQTNKSSKPNYTITKSWDLPKKLNEVSGISYISEDLIACIQDEDGIIFVYDLAKQEIVQEVPFAGAGDYEGIAIVKDDAFVMRSDGMLYQIANYRGKEASVTFVQTTFNSKNDMESLFYDVDDNSLLTIPKDKDVDDNFKNVYTIALSSKDSQPGIKAKIDINVISFKDNKSKKNNKTFNPSEVAVNNQTKDIFILESKTPSILILDNKGIVKQHYKLKKGDFAQPEGLTFSADGRLFISNEAGKNSKANIIEVSLDK